MPHIDPERLALLAMGESVLPSADSEHLAECAECVDELAALRHAALAGRATLDIGELESPPDVVWQRIAAELSLGGSAEAAGSSTSEAEWEAPASATATAPASASPSTGVAPSATEEPAPRTTAPRQRRRMNRGWALAAALTVVAGAGIGTWAALSQSSSTSDIAEASLAPFPAHEDATGSAIVEEDADGALSLTVRLSADAAPDTYREVWLITADASALVSLGVLDGRSASFPVPEDVDLTDYVLVDISQEPVDGDPSHSGDSIVRGELTFL